VNVIAKRNIDKSFKALIEHIDLPYHRPDSVDGKMVSPERDLP